MKAKPATITNKIEAELILALEQNKELSEFEIKNIKEMQIQFLIMLRGIMS